MTTFDVGDLVTLSIEQIKDAAGTVVDPASVTLKLKPPRAAVQTYTGAQLQHPATGKYTRDVTLDTEGVWHVRWETTGTPTLAEETDLVVRRSKVLA